MTHYDLLEVHPKASPEVIRAAFKSLMQKYHPDRRPGDAEAAKLAAQIAAAYEVLSDADKRKQYDQSISNALQSEVQFEGPQLDPVAASNREAYLNKALHAKGQTRMPSRSGAYKHLMIVIFIGCTIAAIWLLATKQNAKLSPADELLRIRTEFGAAGATEAKRRQLLDRKASLLLLHPDEKLKDQLAEHQSRQERSMDLLLIPMTYVQKYMDLNAIQSKEVVIPRIEILVGSFDGKNLIQQAEKNRGILLNQVLNKIGNDIQRDPESEHYQRELKAVVRQAVNEALGIDSTSEKTYPSSYHESPGRYGVIQVDFPAGVEIKK